MRVMVLWSGGVESTSLLKNLLETTDEQVVAHHIIRTSPEGRTNVERTAIDLLTPELQHIRHFEVSFSTVSICGGAAFPMDYSVDYPIGLIAMYHHYCQRLYRAGCAEDDWDHALQPNGAITVSLPDPEPGFSHRRRAATLGPLMRPGENPQRDCAMASVLRPSQGSARQAPW